MSILAFNNLVSRVPLCGPLLVGCVACSAVFAGHAHADDARHLGRVMNSPEAGVTLYETRLQDNGDRLRFRFSKPLKGLTSSRCE